MYDYDLVEAVSKVVNVPIIASGGAGNKKDIAKALKAGADAALLASILHYGETAIVELKQYLQAKGTEVRL